MKSIPPHSDISIDQLKDISAWVSFAHDLNQLLELILETGARIMRAKGQFSVAAGSKNKKALFQSGHRKKKRKRLKNLKLSLVKELPVMSLRPAIRF